jgi:hypothetical protein
LGVLTAFNARLGESYEGIEDNVGHTGTGGGFKVEIRRMFTLPNPR